MSAAAIVVINNNDNLKTAPRSLLLMKRETNIYGSPIGEYKYVNVIVNNNSRNNDNNNDDDNEEVKQQLYHHSFRNHKVNHYGTKKNGWKVALETMVIKDESCTTIDDWFHLFLSDDAPHSFKKYQTDVIGDTDIVVQNWEEKKRQNNKTTATTNNIFDDDELERSITYLHPIIPGGVATKMLGSSTMTVETFQHQVWSRFGHYYGAILRTTTNVVGGTGVPMMGDCFHVETDWLMEQQVKGNRTNNNNTDSSKLTTIKVSVRFRIVFTKRTMFQGVITKSVIAETQRWFDGYKKMISMTTATTTSIKVVEEQ